MSPSLMAPEGTERLASIFVRVPSSPLSTISFKRRVAGWNLPAIGLEHINETCVAGPTGNGKPPEAPNASLEQTQTSCVSLRRYSRLAFQVGHVFQPRVPSWSTHSEGHWVAVKWGGPSRIMIIRIEKHTTRLTGLYTTSISGSSNNSSIRNRHAAPMKKIT